MKKIYEVPAMEIVRLDASENIAKLPTIDSSSSETAVTGDNRVTTTTKTSGLVKALMGAVTSNNIEG